VTDSISGFLFPEEREALERRRAAERDAQLDGVARLVLQVLAERGPIPLTELIEQVGQRPRVVMAAVDDLEKRGLLEVVVRDVQEIAELTEAGRRSATPL
jgi:DNA-binding MarR family transcriptional regulator